MKLYNEGSFNYITLCDKCGDVCHDCKSEQKGKFPEILKHPITLRKYRYTYNNKCDRCYNEEEEAKFKSYQKDIETKTLIEICPICGRYRKQKLTMQFKKRYLPCKKVLYKTKLPIEHKECMEILLDISKVKTLPNGLGYKLIKQSFIPREEVRKYIPIFMLFAEAQKYKNTKEGEESMKAVITKRTSKGIREAMFEEIDLLRNGKSTFKRARAMAGLAHVILQSVDLEIRYNNYVIGNDKAPTIGMLSL